MPESGTLPRRKLGRTDDKLSIIGFGGILVRNMEQPVANDLVARAYDHGVNYFDIAPTYGNAQYQLGPALKPHRQRCFLACKTLERTKVGAERELNESLKLLETDHFDLYQLHALTTAEDVEQAFGPDGAMELFLKAKQEGKTRYLGFSAHSETAARLAMEKFDFDTVLFPINFVCWFKGNFGSKVVAAAREKKMGILALKSWAFGPVPPGTTKPYPKLWYIPVVDSELAALALRFTLSQGTTAAIPPGEETFFWKAVTIAQQIEPITTEESQRLQQMAMEAVPLFKSN
ncbi:MAG: aldo/keto reductase [candidate division KSB1 bacterium]|nr:aldo/keto reductase [candidate division KSB1 bacterium]